jgi:hypothetical protein
MDITPQPQLSSFQPPNAIRSEIIVNHPLFVQLSFWFYA